MNYRGNWHDNARRDLLPGGGTGIATRLAPAMARRGAQARGQSVDRMLYFDNHTICLMIIW